MPENIVKPCPNCGSNDVIYLPTIVNCQNCHLAVSNSGYLENPVSIWNSLPRRSEIERLEKETDWLAHKLSWVSLWESDLEESGFNCPGECEQVGCTLECRQKYWRESARKAVEEK